VREKKIMSLERAGRRLTFDSASAFGSPPEVTGQLPSVTTL
jgi:hypothetical protein